MYMYLHKLFMSSNVVDCQKSSQILNILNLVEYLMYVRTYTCLYFVNRDWESYFKRNSSVKTYNMYQFIAVHLHYRSRIFGETD